MSTDEFFPIVDTLGNVIGKATRRECHSGSMLLHPVVHLHIFSTDRKQIYLQRRSPDKDIQPGKWDTAVGGHVDYGESILTALMRESREELGITCFSPQHLFTYPFQSSVERELVNTYCIFVKPADIRITIDPIEIAEGRFWDISEVRAHTDEECFTPNFINEFKQLLHLPKLLTP